MEQDNSAKETAEYSVVASGIEYEVFIDRSGKGVCLNRSAFHGAIASEDPLMGIKGLLFGDRRSCRRSTHLQGEFSFPITLPRDITDLIWQGWDEINPDQPETCLITPASVAREAKLDPLVASVILDTLQALGR